MVNAEDTVREDELKEVVLKKRPTIAVNNEVIYDTARASKL